MAHAGVKVRHRRRLREQPAVDIRERFQIVVERVRPFRLGSVEDFEELGDARAHIRAVRAGAVSEVVLERLRLKDARVVCEVAEHEADEEQLESVPDVTGVIQRLVQTSHALRGVAVNRRGFVDNADLFLDEKPEQSHVVWQVRQRKGADFAGVEVEELEGTEVTCDHCEREIVVRDPVEVSERLPLRGRQIASRTLLFDQQLARKEHVDEPVFATGELHRVLEVTARPPSVDTELL